MRGVAGFASPLALAAVVFALGAALGVLAAAGLGAALVVARFGGALAAAALGAALALGAAFALGAAADFGLALGFALGSALAFGAALALGSALGFGAALALAAAAGLGAAVARRFGLSSAGVGLRAMAASSFDTSRVQRCRPDRGGGSGVFPGGNETPLGARRSPLRAGKQRSRGATVPP